MNQKGLVIKMDEDIRKGYERIAFGSISDAVKLIFCEAPPRAVNKMDLFAISEIKKIKGGGMEIKFFDRLKALQCLEGLKNDEKVQGGFYEALEAGAKALNHE